MATEWTQDLLDEAQALAEDRNYLSALKKLLVIFDVYPDQPEARLLASAVAREGSRRTTDARPGEALEPRHLFDSRLNPIFCECEAPGCTASWVSSHYLVQGSEAVVSNPLGARCKSCGVTLCRRHLSSQTVQGALSCPRCRGSLDGAPSPNGRRRTNQTPRLNKPLAHVVVLVEGKQPPSPAFLTELFQHMTPDVFDDSPRLTGHNERKFKGDGSEFALMLALAANADYATDDYEIQSYPGQQAERRGHRWVIVKVFENRPKHVDPDNPATHG